MSTCQLTEFPDPLARPDLVWSTCDVILKNISEAKAELSALIDAVAKGEQVIIGKAGVPVAKLIPYRGAASPRIAGSMRGQIVISDDFDELPDDIAAAFGVVP